MDWIFYCFFSIFSLFVFSCHFPLSFLYLLLKSHSRLVHLILPFPQFIHIHSHFPQSAGLHRFEADLRLIHMKMLDFKSPYFPHNLYILALVLFNYPSLRLTNKQKLIRFLFATTWDLEEFLPARTTRFGNCGSTVREVICLSPSVSLVKK